MAENARAGRKRSYSEVELGIAIDAANVETGDATVSSVLRQLVNRFDVSPAINQRSLEIAIREMLGERELASETARIERLPAFVADDVTRMLDGMRRQLLGGVGRMRDRLEEPAAKLREELALTQRMGREARREHERERAEAAEREEALVAELAAKDETIAAKEAEIAFLKDNLAERDAELFRRATYEQLLADLRSVRGSSESGASAKK